MLQSGICIQCKMTCTFLIKRAISVASVISKRSTSAFPAKRSASCCSLCSMSVTPITALLSPSWMANTLCQAKQICCASLVIIKGQRLLVLEEEAGVRWKLSFLKMLTGTEGRCGCSQEDPIGICFVRLSYVVMVGWGGGDAFLGG